MGTYAVVKAIWSKTNMDRPAAAAVIRAGQYGTCSSHLCPPRGEALQVFMAVRAVFSKRPGSWTCTKNPWADQQQQLLSRLVKAGRAQAGPSRSESHQCTLSQPHRPSQAYLCALASDSLCICK